VFLDSNSVNVGKRLNIIKGKLKVKLPSKHFIPKGMLASL
jgi:hypothetical protein